MNLRKYYQDVKEVRSKMESPYVYLTSLDTPNGGKAGCVCEVDADIAARMLVDGVARQATEEEIADYLQEGEKLLMAAKEEQLRNRLRVTLVSEPQFEVEAKPEGSSTRPEPKAKNRS